MRTPEEIHAHVSACRAQVARLENLAKTREYRDVGDLVDRIRSLRSRVEGLRWVLDGEKPMSHDA